ncbi:MAG: tyrosine recombinase [Phycisphaerales bacterium]|nr:tyrosine recombinase [Phycisphaerales bacterium]
MADSSFDQPVRDFLAFARVEAGLSSATLEAYARDLSDLIRDLQVRGLTDPAAVQPDDLAEHLRDLARVRGMQPSSIARHLATIRVFFRWLDANHRIERDPARLLERPTRWKKLPGVMSPRSMRQLVETPAPEFGQLWLRDRAMLELMYAAGLRASEVGRIRLNEFHEETMLVTVHGKGAKTRIVPIGEPARDWTLKYIDEERPRLARFKDGRDDHRLLLSAGGRPLERVAVWQIVRKYAKLSGLDGVHPHLLRHSFATHLVQGGADLRVVQELLGHSDIGTTQVYTHVDRTHLRDVIRTCLPRG